MNLLNEERNNPINHNSRNNQNRGNGYSRSRNNNAMINFIELLANRNRRNEIGKMTNAEIKKIPII